MGKAKISRVLKFVSSAESLSRAKPDISSGSFAQIHAALHGGMHIWIRLSAKHIIPLPAPAVVERLLPMAINTENTVLKPATFPDALGGRYPLVTKKYRARLEQYLSSMMQARQMLSQGIIVQADYAKIDTIIAAKYGLESCNLYRGIDLLYKEVRGNMPHYEEVITCPK